MRDGRYRRVRHIGQCKRQYRPGNDGIDREFILDDLVFSDEGTYGGGNTAVVGVNFDVSWTTTDPTAHGDRLIIAANLDGGVMELNDTLFNPFTATVTTLTTVVDLGEEVSLQAIADLRITDSIPGSEGGSGYFRLADIPFILPAGITVNSVSAGLVDNAFGSGGLGGTPVPEPFTVGILSAGLLGIACVRRRSERAAAPSA